MAGGPACELFSRLSSSWNVELSTVCHKMSRIFLWTDFSLGHQISTNIYIYPLSLYSKHIHCRIYMYMYVFSFYPEIKISHHSCNLKASEKTHAVEMDLMVSPKIGEDMVGWMGLVLSVLRNGKGKCEQRWEPPKKGWKADTAKQQRNQQMIFWPQEHLLPDQRGQFRHRFGWQAVDPFGLEPHLTLIRFLKTRCSVLRRYKMFTWIFL